MGAGEPEPELVLRSRDGTAAASVIARGVDEAGAWLHMRHETSHPRRLAGPHWHPALVETFTVRTGRLGLARDGRWRSLGPGEEGRVEVGEVHASRCEDGPLVMDHVIRPPGRHQEMFELMHALEHAGRLTRAGLPRNPLALGLLWRMQDGYVAGLPIRLQELVFGGLDRLARRLGYHRRLAVRTGYDPARWDA